MKKLTTAEYIEKFEATHGDLYNYSLVEYSSTTTPVEIICKTHGSFWQQPSDHRRGFGCPSCSGKKRSTTESFILKAQAVHLDAYDYSEVDYQSLDIEIAIICKKHGPWKTKPRYHIYGTASGCAKYQRSKGEIAIAKYLKENSIIFEEQKIFEDCGLKRFDFYLPEYNMVIEFDGAQHFHAKHQRARDKEKGQTRFEDVKRRDREKDVFCKENNIKLLRVSYLQLKQINKILKQWIFV